MSDHAVLLTAAIWLWFEVLVLGVKAISALSEEKAATMLVHIMSVCAFGYLAARLWGMA